MGITITNSGQGSVVRFRNLGRGGVMTTSKFEPLLLDTYPNAAASYSFRKLSNSYAGSSIRVRRSSDNAEQDIGFVGRNLDTTSLASFAGYQNLSLYSEDYTNAYWTKNGGSVTLNSTQAPDGNVTGNKFTEDSGNSVHRVYESRTFITGAVYTYSVYLKYIGRRYVMVEQSNSSGIQVIFDIQNGLVAASVGAAAPLSTNVTSVGNGWYRCSITFTYSASGTTIIIGGNNSGTVAALTYTGLNGDAFYIWGSQLNIGFIPQTYQKTTSATNIQYITTWYDQSGNSRNASMATQANQPQILIAPENNVIASSWHERNNYLNTSAFAMGTSISTFWLGKRTGGDPGDCFFGDNDANYDCRTDVAQIQTGGVTVGNFGLFFTNYRLGSLLRISGGSKAYLNNTQSSTTNTTTLSAAGTRPLSIGRRGLDTGINLQGWIREIIIYNSDQTNNLLGINTNLNSFYSIYPNDPDAQAFVSRVNAAGGSLTTTEGVAIDQLVISMKAAGIWSLMKAIYPMVGSTEASCKQNLVSSNFTGTLTGGWNFSRTGITSTGAGVHFDTGLNPRNETSGFSQHVSMYSRTQNTSLSGVQLGAYDGTAELNLYQYYASIGLKGGSAYVYPSTAVTINNTNTLGLQIVSRTSNTSLKLYFNGSLLNTNTTTETLTRPNRTIYIGASNWTSGANQFTTHENAFTSIGDGLTDQQSSDLYTIVQAFQTSLSRQV
jgi:hypothetical protein